MGIIRKFSKRDTVQNEKLYEEYHKKYHWLDGWDRGNKKRNFESMLHLPELTGVPISGTSCLDVGCGTGDFSKILRQRGAIRYLGIDIYKPSLNKAEKKYPEEEFVFADILSGEITEMFDYAFCSGALTVKLSVNNYDFLESIVSKMWHLTRVGIVFNVLTDDDLEPNPDLFFYNISKVTRICEKIVTKGNIDITRSEEVSQAHFYLYRES